MLIVGAIAFVELRFGRLVPSETQAEVNPSPAEPVGPTTGPNPKVEDGSEPGEADREGAAERVARKEAEFPRAKEITGPTGFINTDETSIGENLGEKVVLLEFWTYS